MRRMPLYKAAWKPRLFMGCEKAPFLIVAITAAILVIEGSLWVKIIGAVYFVAMVGLMAFFNSKDPFAFTVLFRYWKYQDYYASHALYPGRPDRPKNF